MPLGAGYPLQHLEMHLPNFLGGLFPDQLAHQLVDVAERVVWTR